MSDQGLPCTLQTPCGSTILFSPQDYPLICGFPWKLDTWGYVDAHRPYTGVISLHRLIMSPPPHLQVDHINHNKLDNRRQNLRVCTRQQNLCNRPTGKTSQSGYRGVYPQDGKYRARIAIQGRRIGLGTFACPHDAARAYNTAALQYHGEFASLNEVPE